MTIPIGACFRLSTPKVAAIKHGLQKELFLGNIDAKRDWGYAPEYVEGIWRVMQHEEGDDFILATGESHTVRDFVEAAFGHADLDWKAFVRHDPRYERPAEVDVLSGLLQGYTAKVIAKSRGASVNTVRSQIMAILGKTGHRSQKELIAAFGASSFDPSAFDTLP